VGSDLNIFVKDSVVSIKPSDSAVSMRPSYDTTGIFANTVIGSHTLSRETVAKTNKYHIQYI
jgi:hypothetical protein